MKIICSKRAAALALGLALVICLCLAGCTQKADKPQNKEDVTVTARKVVEDAFGALKKGDFQKAQEYIPDLDPEEYEEYAEDSENRLATALLKQALAHMEYKVTDVKADGDDKAIVSVDVKNLDMAAVVEDYYSAVVDAILAKSDGDGELSQEEMDKLMEELSTQLAQEKKTMEDTIQVEVEAGVFELDSDQLDKMLGGLLTVGEKIDE